MTLLSGDGAAPVRSLDSAQVPRIWRKIAQRARDEREGTGGREIKGSGNDREERGHGGSRGEVRGAPVPGVNVST